MLPSSTVENYLKTLYKAQAALAGGPENLVPMGQLAAALGVVPGTATTMVKTLAETGLVQYEPYVGVRLTPAGEKLAALVLRRHRLIELFLVTVMGMSWDEVHDEAEQLEHAVSDRLIDRIDAILGRPSVDPHGDPIPDAHGAMEPREYDTLLTCPLNTRVVVARVADQDAEFLRFVESSDLKPGQTIEVEARDGAADCVRVKGKDGSCITIGARAASKLLVQIAAMTLFALGLAAPARAQTLPSQEPFQIRDNSFLMEEAFNQDAGVVQNIVGFIRLPGGDWELTLTQEWPLGGTRHQFSYSLPFLGSSAASGLGDALLNYRLQVLTEGPGKPAFAPRLTVIVPSGSQDKGLGEGTLGWQVNLPFSKQRGDLYWHWNAGITHLPDVDLAALFPGAPGVQHGSATDLTALHFGGSVNWRLRPMLNPLIETMVVIAEAPEATGTIHHETVVTMLPGIRGGWNLRDQQIVIGVGAPIVVSADRADVAGFLYFSYELPFRRP